jgi:hypothetical protein
VIECADPAVAAMIANDLRDLCRLVGERHLAVPLEAELKFRTALRRLGYVVPAGSASPARSRSNASRSRSS